MSDFLKDLQRGKQGEVMVANAFRKMNYDVQDVSNNKEFQKKDIDLVIDDNGTSRYMEVKADWTMGTSGNIVLELWKQANSENLGWYSYTEATHLAFCDMKNKIAYICRTADLKKRIAVLKDEALRKFYYGETADLHKNDITPKVLNGYYCYLFSWKNNQDIFNKVAL